jgi:hypothetical protein
VINFSSISVLIFMKEEKSVTINHDTRVLNPSCMGKEALPGTKNSILWRRSLLSKVLSGASECFFPSPSWEQEGGREIYKQFLSYGIGSAHSCVINSQKKI